LGKITKDSNASYEQIFYVCIALIAGTLAGVWGGFWSAIAFEYIIKHDTTLGLVFVVSTIILVVMLMPFIVLMVYTFRKLQKSKTL
jgi:ABC-type methionine transport system permease subunit